MKPNRVRRNSAKSRPISQSPKTTETTAEKPVVENPDVRQLFAQAVGHILKSNQTRYGLTTENIAERLPSFGLAFPPEEVREVLDTMKKAGTASCMSGEFWRAEPEGENQPDLNSLLPLLNPVLLERAMHSVSAVLELLRCKLIADAGEEANSLSSVYDSDKAAQLIGILELIYNAQKDLFAADEASVDFAKAFRRAAGMPA